MDLNAIVSISWGRLRELLENSECIRQFYLPSVPSCIMKTSDSYLRERAVFYKRKHGSVTRRDANSVRLGQVTKSMHTHSKAIYSAWESLAELQAEYDALKEVEKASKDAAAERERVSQQRMLIREEAAARNRALSLAALNKKGIDIGGDAEDEADALEDEKEERFERKAQAIEEAEQKEAERKSAIRTRVLTTYTIEQAAKLLPLLNHLTSQECEAYLRTVHNEKPVNKVPPPPPPVVQPVVSIKTTMRKKNRNRDLSSSESDSDLSVDQDSPRKEQRMNDLSSSMSSVAIVEPEKAKDPYF